MAPSFHRLFTVYNLSPIRKGYNEGGNLLARSHYQYKKREKELARKHKKEEKKQRKLDEKELQSESNEDQLQLDEKDL